MESFCVTGEFSFHLYYTFEGAWNSKTLFKNEIFELKITGLVASSCYFLYTTTKHIQYTKYLPPPTDRGGGYTPLTYDPKGGVVARPGGKTLYLQAVFKSPTVPTSPSGGSHATPTADQVHRARSVYRGGW